MKQDYLKTDALLRDDNERTAVTVRMPEWLKRDIQKEADAFDVSFNTLACLCLRKGIDFIRGDRVEP